MPDKRTGPVATPDPPRSEIPIWIGDSVTGGRGTMVRRLAAIELTRMLRGPAAEERPTPAGPSTCSAACRYCTRRRAA